MSSFPSRTLEIWKSSRADDLGELHGAFCFNLAPTLMVTQTMEYLFERQGREFDNAPLINPFIQGMYYFDAKIPSNLFWAKSFKNATELHSFDYAILWDAIRQLELHTDINLTYSQVSYLANIGTGPSLPLLIINRLPIGRGVAFEVEERGIVNESLANGDITISDEMHVAQQHYSTGMGLLAVEDALTGLIDAAFMQFYLSLEALLGAHEKKKAVENGKSKYGTQFIMDYEKLVTHVYLARHRFFGHAHPEFRKGLSDSETAFQIAKQTLVARWVARTVMALEVKRPLVIREMRLYPNSKNSVYFNGSVDLLENEFELPI